MVNSPKILLFSGKRKCGKDYVTDKLYSMLDSKKVVIVKISGPIKNHWAKENGLSFEDLMGADEFKEKHRKEMLVWSQDIRKSDYGYFCSAAVKMYKAHEYPIWIVSDIRRRTDLKWFRENYNDIKTIKIVCNNTERENRGWVFTPGVDDMETECDLDSVSEWDKVIVNEPGTDLDQILKEIITNFIQ